MIEYLSGQELEEVLTDELTIVDFYADWCGPCKLMAEELENFKNIKTIKVNVDTHEEIAQKHGIMSIPTVEIYKNKELLSKFIGFKTAEEIKELLNSLDK